MTSEYNCGFAAGRKAGQPEWISVDDHLPDHDGNYYSTAGPAGAYAKTAGWIVITSSRL